MVRWTSGSVRRQHLRRLTAGHGVVDVVDDTDRLRGDPIGHRAHSDALCQVVDSSNDRDEREHAECDGDQDGDVRYDAATALLEVPRGPQREQTEHGGTEDQPDCMLQRPVAEPVTKRPG